MVKVEKTQVIVDKLEGEEFERLKAVGEKMIELMESNGLTPKESLLIVLMLEDTVRKMGLTGRVVMD